MGFPYHQKNGDDWGMVDYHKEKIMENSFLDGDLIGITMGISWDLW